jgi:hypothetical protein
MDDVSENQTYTPASTALDAILPIFFHPSRTVGESISSPIHPAAAVLLCLLANADDEGGLSETRMKIHLRFAFDRETAAEVVTAGIENVLKTDLVESYVEPEANTKYRLTAAGKAMMIDTLGSVFKNG